LPVGVTTAISAVSEKSCVSWSKTRGVNDMSPNVVRLCDVLAVTPDGLMMGNPLEALLATTKGIFVINCRRRLNGV
jgi:hypothetical protein